MGLFTGRKTAEEAPAEGRSITISNDGVMNDWVNASPIESFLPTSMQVSPSSAFSSVIVVYACVALRAETTASLPIFLYRKNEEGREVIPEQNATPGPVGWQGRLARMLHQSPNPEMTSQEFWETAVGHIDLWGNSYSNIVRTAGRPDALWPLRPDRMLIDRVKGQKVYIYTTLEGESRKLAPSEVMHIRGMSLDGVYGVSPIGVARSALRIAKASENTAEGFWSKGGVPAGVLETNEPLRGNTEQQKEQLKVIREGYESMHSGFDNAHRVAILNGVSWKDVGMPLDDAQFLETRRYQKGEIAMLYRIPPHMIGDVERSTSWGTGIENQAQGFLTFTLRPLLKRIEQAINRDLGFPGEDAQTLLDERIFAEFEAAGLLRADTKSRYEAYAIALQNKFMVPNQARRLENWPPLEGGDVVIELPGQTGQQAATQQQQGLELVASILGREMPPPNVTVNNHPATRDDTGALAEGVEGLRNEIRAVELLKGMKGDLEAMHDLRDETRLAQEATREIAQELLDTTTAKVDALATETRAVQTSLFAELGTLKRPRVRNVVRNPETNFIERIVDEVEEPTLVSSNGKPKK